MFQEVESIEIFKMSWDIVPENSRCISNCVFTRINTHFRYGVLTQNRGGYYVCEILVLELIEIAIH